MNGVFNKIIRRKTRKLRLGDIQIGGESPITVQSMANTKTKDIQKTVEQIRCLEEAGCEIIRVAVPDMESALAVSRLRSILAFLW